MQLAGEVEKERSKVMSEKNEFDYFYGIEADQFTFYRIPRILVKDDRFRNLSSDAKLLYGLLLDRMSLSMRNGWVDEKNRTYIVYKIGHIAEDLNCSEDKAARVLTELDSKKGIGLVERVRRGLGKPDIIYVKNFVGAVEKYPEEPKRKEKEPEPPCDSTEPVNCGFKKPQICDSRNRKSAEQETVDMRLKKPQDCGTRNRTDATQETADYGPINNTDINNTEKSNTDSNHINLSWGGRTSLKEKLVEKKGQIDRMDDIQSLQALIRKNIEYDDHMKYDDYDDRQIYDELYQLICDTVCVKRDTVRIEGQDYPYELVKSRFLKLDHFHLEYVKESMKHTTSDIGNIKNYLLTTLYNAPATINHYYQQAVQHDMYGGVI